MIALLLQLYVALPLLAPPAEVVLLPILFPSGGVTMASPAPVRGPTADKGLEDDLDLMEGTLLAAPIVAETDDPFSDASNILMASLTLDFLALALVGAEDEAGGVGMSCPLILADLTGLGLLPSFASSLLGSDMGRGMRDFPPLLDRAPPPLEVVLQLNSSSSSGVEARVAAFPLVAHEAQPLVCMLSGGGGGR